jgi:hypothetical protein
MDVVSTSARTLHHSKPVAAMLANKVKSALLNLLGCISFDCDNVCRPFAE